MAKRAVPEPQRASHGRTGVSARVGMHRLGHSSNCLWCAQIQHDFNRNKYFDTKEALEYGVIDRIIKPPRTRVLGV